MGEVVRRNRQVEKECVGRREEGCFKGRRRRWSVQADGYGVEGESKGGCGGNGEERKVTEAEGEKREEDTNGSENQESLGLSIPCLIKKKTN